MPLSLEDAENLVAAIQPARLVAVLIGSRMSALALAVSDGDDRLPDATYDG